MVLPSPMLQESNIGKVCLMFEDVCAKLERCWQGYNLTWPHSALAVPVPCCTNSRAAGWCPNDTTSPQ